MRLHNEVLKVRRGIHKHTKNKQVTRNVAIGFKGARLHNHQNLNYNVLTIQDSFLNDSCIFLVFLSANTVTSVLLPVLEEPVTIPAKLRLENTIINNNICLLYTSRCV